MRFGGRVIRASAGLPLRIRGLPRRLHRGHRVTFALRLRDQFGSPAAGVTVTASGSGVHRLTATTARNGTVKLSLVPGRRGVVKLTLTGPGYAHTIKRVRVR